MELTLEQKIGQMLMVGWQGVELKELLENIRKYHFGNIILFTRNIKSPEQVAEMCEQIQKVAVEANGIPAFIGLDQEGGCVRRIYDGVTNVCGPMATAAASAQEPDCARSVGRIVGEGLKKLGINLNLAPVVDVNTNPYNPVIAIRSYGDDPHKVAKHAAQYSQGLQSAGVLACYKHFPGHGDVDVDSHLDLPRSYKTLDQLLDCELVPYKSIMADAVMSVHILFRSIDDKFPASISDKFLKGILRGQLGYRGLIVTDCFEMDGLCRSFNFEEAAVFAALASTDIITVSHTFGRQVGIRNALLAAVQSGEFDVKKLDETVDRILDAKSKYCAPALYRVDETANKIKSDKISRASITLLSGEPVPLTQGTVVVGVTNFLGSIAEDANVEQVDVARELGQAFNLPYKGIDNKNFNVSEILSFIGKNNVVLCLSDSHLTLVQKVLYSTILNNGNHVQVISMRTPYDVLHQEQPACHICTFEYTTTACRSLIAALKENKFYGESPVNLKLLGYLQKERTVKNYLLENIIGYMRVNYSQRLTLDSVAAEFLITGTHLCKLMKKKLNKSFVDVLAEIRLEEAKRLLTTTNLKVYEIGILCGYRDSNYFSKIFQKHTGVLPIYFRNNFKTH